MPLNNAQLRQLIAEARLEETIPELLARTNGTHLHQEALMLSAQLSEYKKLLVRGTESSGDMNQRLNRITYGLLELVNRLPEDGTAPPPPIPPASPAAALNGNGSGAASNEDKNPADPGSSALPSAKFPFWFSMAAFVVLILISLLVPGWAQQNHSLFKTLLSLAAAGVAATLPGFLNLEWNGMVKAGGALAAFVLVFFINPTPEEVPFTLTVSVRVQKPSPAYPDLKNAELWLWQENDWRKAPVSPDGIADFKNLAPALTGRCTPIQLKAEFFSAAADSLLIQPPAVNLTVRPDGSLERVFGKITNPAGLPLAGVVVEVESRFDTSDVAGNYELRVPPDAQKTHYLLHATAKGFKPYRNEVWPASGALDFSMSR